MPATRIMGWKRSKYWKPILHSSKSPKTPRKSFLELIRIIERKKYTRGPTPCLGDRGRPPVGRGRLSPGPPGGLPASIFCYMKGFVLEKIVGKLTGRNSAATRRNLGGTNLGLRRSCSTGETSLREGEIITIVITNAPLIGRGQSPSTSSPAPSHLQTLVHLLYPILVSKSGIGVSRLLVVLITPCS